MMLQTQLTTPRREPWNKGKLIGQKPPLKLKEVWAIRIRLQIAGQLGDLALFNLGIDSKLRGGDLTSLRLNDVQQGGRVLSRAIIQQNRPTRSVRNHASVARSDRCVARRGRDPGWRLLVPEPNIQLATSFDPAIRAVGPKMGIFRRT